MSEQITFEAEITEVKSKKLVTNDLEYSLRLVGSDSKIIELAKIPADCTVKVTIKANL